MSASGVPDPRYFATWQEWAAALLYSAELQQLGDPSNPFGTVSSVAFAAPVEFTVTGSPITSSGTITLVKAAENANTVWAGPASGGPAQPTFRALTVNDIPSSSLLHNNLGGKQGGTDTGPNGGVEYYHATYSRYTWPEIKEIVSAGETLKIDVNYQVAVHGNTFTIDGTVIADGSLYVVN